jgi:hypothetical protein
MFLPDIWQMLRSLNHGIEQILSVLFAGIVTLILFVAAGIYQNRFALLRRLRLTVCLLPGRL